MFSTPTGISIQDLAKSVLRLSDFYIQNPDAETPWREKYCQQAYRYYYLPLNFTRCQRVVQQGLKVGFFEGLTDFIDWGAGPGTASLALAAEPEIKIREQILFDLRMETLKEFSDLHSNLVHKKYLDRLDLKNLSKKNSSCLVFSYSLTELEHLPDGWNEFEALMILEPSTSQDGRRLLKLRDELISAGYSIWAPCTHQNCCPLLNQSQHDWCHDRVKVEAPEWFTKLEQLLPMKNKTVTTSYLLARRNKAPEILQNKVRLTGDSMEEKGKTRQLICRGENREFLTWMHKKIEPQTLPRGELIELPESVEMKSNELRLSESIKLI